jgi:hypothetical protein
MTSLANVTICPQSSLVRRKPQPGEIVATSGHYCAFIGVRQELLMCVAAISPVILHIAALVFAKLQQPSIAGATATTDSRLMAGARVC